MQLLTSKSIELETAKSIKFDAFICSSGYEKRCIAMAKVFDDLLMQKVVLAFDSHLNNQQRVLNNEYFHKSGFSFVPANGNESLQIYTVLDKLVASCTSSRLSILVDYSSMTSLWYASIINYFNYLKPHSALKEVKVTFSYSFSEYSPSIPTSTFNKLVGPIEGFCNISIPDRPTALIIGLGYEKEKAFGLSEYLDAETFIFYTDAEQGNASFSNEVLEQNKELLSSIKPENIYSYPILMLNQSYSILYSLCSELVDDYRVILAPCGPKPFTLLSLLVASKLKQVDVWRISSGPETTIYDRGSNGSFSFMECLYK